MPDPLRPVMMMMSGEERSADDFVVFLRAIYACVFSLTTRVTEHICFMVQSVRSFRLFVYTEHPAFRYQHLETPGTDQAHPTGEERLPQPS